MVSSSSFISTDQNDDDVKSIGMIGSLLFLTTNRPGIMFPTILCAHYQADTKESHLLVVKRIFCYLKHTPNIGLWYPHDFEITLVGCTDFHHGGHGIDRKITSGGAQMIGNRLVSCSSKK